MKSFHNKLKTDIENKLGFKILSTTEAKYFCNLLEEHGIDKISLSTIRRFWGLIPQRRPNENTLNALAFFLGYKSFFAYVKSKNRFEKWFEVAQIQRLKHKDKLKKTDFQMIEALYKKDPTTFLSVSLLEHALYFKKWNYAADLLNPKNIGLLQDNTDVTEYSAKQAYLLNIYLNAIPKEQFESVIDNLVAIDGFRNYCIYLYVDIMQLNHRYGFVIDRISALVDKSQEEALFLKLLKNLWEYLNGKSIKPVAIDSSIFKNYPYVLTGRYYGYQILYNTVHENDAAIEYYWKEFLNRINAKTDVRQYLNEFIHHLILAKAFDKLSYILESFYEDALDNFHLHHYLDVFIFGLMDVMTSYTSGDLKRAKAVFFELDTTKIIYGSYCDYYLIFYNLMGYHLCNDTAEKEVFKNTYLKLTQAACFTRFNEQYLKDYFLHEG